MTGDLAAFLRTQLDADEQTARAAAYWDRFDPAFTLADITAKRAIIDLHRAVQFTDRDLGIIDRTVCFTCHGVLDSPSDDDDWRYPLVQLSFPCPTLRLLAQPYAGRPGNWHNEWNIT